MEQTHSLEHINLDVASKEVNDNQEIQVPSEDKDKSLQEFIDSQRNHLFENVVSWLKKKTRGVYEQVSSAQYY